MENADNQHEVAVDLLTTVMRLENPTLESPSKRVAAVAIELARAMGLCPRAVAHVWLAGILHDVGKIAVPTRLLLKRTRLTASEQRLVRRHVELTARLLEAGRLPPEVVKIAAQHHERLDGSGYPRGLRGDEIPLEARALAVADVYVALVSDRPYRSALEPDEALEHIRQQSGSAFDSTDPI